MDAVCAKQGNDDLNFKKDMSHLTWQEVLRRQATRTPLMAAWFAAIDLQPGSRVLDFGSGPGFVSLAMAQIVGAAGIVYAIDRAPEALAMLKTLQITHGYTNIARIVADATTLPTLGIDVDCAAMTMVLHHTDDQQAILSSVAAVLPTGASCVVAEFHPDGPCTLGPPQAVRVGPEQIARWGMMAGLDLVATLRQTPEHYMCVLRRH